MFYKIITSSSIFSIPSYYAECTRWCSWLRHCPTSRKVSGSIPYVIIGIFHWYNSSGGADSASKRNEYQEYFLWSKVGRCIGLTNLPLLCVDCRYIWEPRPSGTPRAGPGVALPLLSYYVNWNTISKNLQLIFLQIYYYRRRSVPSEPSWAFHKGCKFYLLEKKCKHTKIIFLKYSPNY